MADKDSEFIQKWNSSIDQGLRYKEKYSTALNWPTYREFFRGNWPENITRPVNRVFSYTKSLVPRVYFRTPSVVVTAGSEEYVNNVPIIEAVDNWLIRELTLKYTLKRLVPDSALCGTGITKLGYDSEYGYIPDQAVDADLATVTQHSTKSGDKIEYRVNVKPGMPWAIRVRPDDIVTPYGYMDVESLPWIAHMILRPLIDIQEDQKYKNTGDLKGGYTLTANPLLRKRLLDMSEMKEESYCLLYEIRDARTGRMYVICEDQVILDVKDELQIEGLPYEFLMFNEDPDYFWGIPDIKLYLPQVEELNEISEQSSRLRKSSLLKFLIAKGAMKPEDVEKLLSQDIQDIAAGVFVDADSIQASVLPLQPHALMQDVLANKTQADNDARQTIGFSQNQEGAFFPKTSKSATEAQIVQAGAEVRVDERRDMMADVLTNIIRKWNQFIFKFWTEERAVKVVGPDGAGKWVKFTGDQIKGEYGIRIDPEMGLPVSRALKYQQAKELYMMLRGDPFIDQVQLRVNLLRQFEWLDPTATMLVQPETNLNQPGNLFPPEHSMPPGGGAGGNRLPGPDTGGQE